MQVLVTLIVSLFASIPMMPVLVLVVVFVELVGDHQL